MEAGFLKFTNAPSSVWAKSGEIFCKDLLVIVIYYAIICYGASLNLGPVKKPEAYFVWFTLLQNLKLLFQSSSLNQGSSNLQ